MDVGIEIVSGSLELFAALVILMLLVSVCGEHSKGLEARMTGMMICHMFVLLLDAARWFLYQRTEPAFLMITLSVLPTILALVGNGLFVFFIAQYLSRRAPIPRNPIVILFSLFVLAICTWTVFILLNGIQYAPNIQTHYLTLDYHWLYWVGHFLWGAACAVGIRILMSHLRYLKRNELLALLSYCVFPMFALLLRTLWDGAQIFLSTSLSLVWIHMVMHREQRRRLQEQESQLVESRIAILLSQIQPHFLYNTLTAICSLCDTDPREAQNVTTEFADYLRHNLASLTQSTPIPFEQELCHTQIYLKIEQKRFGDRLRIVYDIGVTDFAIPSLAMQPIVENAVKHGVMGKDCGGTVTLSTREHHRFYEIIIQDDGLGFTPENQLPYAESHIGIENVKSRLFAMCRGTLSITSAAAVGTTAILRIPKE